MDLVCDTNVWYDIAAGRRDPQRLKAGGNRLLATPVAFIEIASELSESTFVERSGAALAVATHSDGVLSDPERHLASIWALPVEPLGIEWLDLFKTIGLAPNFAALSTGVPDAEAGVIRTLNQDLVAPLRAHWAAFAGDIERLLDGFFPGYLAARQAKAAKYASKERAQPFAGATALPAIESLAADGTRQRAALHLAQAPAPASAEQLNSATAKLLPYIRAYARYLYNCATRYTPKANDWGDLECFLYLQGRRRLLTRDSRWLEIAEEIGMAHWLLDPEASSSP